MSLSEFSLEMSINLGGGQLDPSVLSRVIKGQRQFTPIQLDVFCTTLKLDPRDQLHLHLAWHQDQCQRYGSSFKIIKFFDEGS